MQDDFSELAAAILEAVRERAEMLSVPPAPPPIDVVCLSRALNRDDLAFAWLHGGWPLLLRRYHLQALTFTRVMSTAWTMHRGLLSRRIDQQDADSERVARDEVRFLWLWFALWIHGAAHFAGFPRGRRVERLYADLRPLAYRRAAVLAM
jgi:hypothetical protein